MAREVRPTESERLMLTAETGGPVADAADGVEAQVLGTRVLPSEELVIFHARAGDELLAGERVREVAPVETFYVTVAVNLHFQSARWHLKIMLPSERASCTGVPPKVLTFASGSSSTSS